MKPKARSRGMSTAWVGDELFLYEVRSSRMHCLNEATAYVWFACNGRRSIDDLTEFLGKNIGGSVAPETVLQSIRGLDEAGLMEFTREPAEASRTSGRPVITRIARWFRGSIDVNRKAACSGG